MKQIKDKNYAFRITEKDLNTIKQKAKRAKMTVTDYITKSADYAQSSRDYKRSKSQRNRANSYITLLANR